MVSFYSARQDASNDIGHVKVKWSELNSWSWPYEVIICICLCVSMRGTHSGTVIFALAWKFKSYCQKIPLTSSAVILTYLTPMTSFLTWPKNDLGKNCISSTLVCNDVYCLSLACFVFDISQGGGGYPPPVGTTWPRPPSVRGFNWNIELETLWISWHDLSRPTAHDGLVLNRNIFP